MICKYPRAPIRLNLEIFIYDPTSIKINMQHLYTCATVRKVKIGFIADGFAHTTSLLPLAKIQKIFVYDPNSMKIDT